MNKNLPFVSDGYKRAHSAAEPQVRALVMAEYAQRLEEAQGVGRVLLLREIEREIKRRLSRQAPPDALY